MINIRCLDCDEKDKVIRDLQALHFENMKLRDALLELAGTKADIDISGKFDWEESRNKILEKYKLVT